MSEQERLAGHNSDQSNTVPVDWRRIAREQTIALQKIDRLSTGWMAGLEVLYLMEIHKITRQALKGASE